MVAKRRTERDRAYDRYRRTLEQLNNIYRRARDGRHTHDWILEQLIALYNRDDYKRLQAGYRSMLSAVRETHMNQLHERDLEWRLGPASGPITPVGSTPGNADRWTPELSELCRIPGALFGAHFWIGTDKPFNEYKCTNEDRSKNLEASANG